MKKFLLLTVFLAGSLVAFAQQNFQEVVYLKNGSILRGTIIEQIPNKSLKIQLNDGSVFVYEIDMVEKITKEPLDNLPKRQREPADINASNLLEQGNSLFVKGADTFSTEGVPYFIEMLEQWGYWNIVSNKEEADFIIEFHYTRIRMGGKGWIVLMTTDQQEIKKSGVYKAKASPYNGYSARADVVRKIVRRYLQKEYK
jgi:hypothetical protein